MMDLPYIEELDGKEEGDIVSFSLLVTGEDRLLRRTIQYNMRQKMPRGLETKTDPPLIEGIINGTMLPYNHRAHYFN